MNSGDVPVGMGCVRELAASSGGGRPWFPIGRRLGGWAGKVGEQPKTSALAKSVQWLVQLPMVVCVSPKACSFGWQLCVCTV